MRCPCLRVTTMTGRSDDDEDDRIGEVFGFLTLHATDPDFTFEDRDEDYPETWLDFDAAGSPRLKPTIGGARARDSASSPTGKVGPGHAAGSCQANSASASAAETLMAALRKIAHGSRRSRPRDAARRRRCSSAARLRWMHGDGLGPRAFKRKLLGFTDNRQDAALQSGHFNDFLFVSLCALASSARSKLLATQGLGSEELGVAQQRALGFDRPDARDPRGVAAGADPPGLQPPRSRENAARGARVSRLVRSAARLALHQPEPRAARARRSRLSRLEDLAADEELFADCTAAAAARVAGVRAGGLSADSRPPAAVDGDPSHVLDADRHRADAGEVPQPPPRAVGLWLRREAAARALALGHRAASSAQQLARRGPDRARRLTQRAGQDAEVTRSYGMAIAAVRATQVRSSIDAFC